MSLFFRIKHLFSEQFREVPLPPSISFAGQTVIVTGANVGLGLEAARHCARRGAARVVVAARSADKAAAAVANIRASLTPAQAAACRLDGWTVDLTSYASVEAFCRRADAELDRLDAVIENAGVGMVQFVPAEGVETTITVNVLSTFFMAVLLLPLLRRTAARFNVTPRLTIVGSDVYMGAKLDLSRPKLLDIYKDPAAMDTGRYNVSKLLILMVIRQLAAILDANKVPVITNIVHPGLCRTEVFRNIPLLLRIPIRLMNRLLGRTAEEGARTLVAGAAAGPESNGGFMSTCEVVPLVGWVTSNDGQTAQKRVFDETLSLLETVHPSLRKNLE